MWYHIDRPHVYYRSVHLPKAVHKSINVSTKVIGIESFGRMQDDASSSFTLLNSGLGCRGKASTVGLTSSVCAS